MLPQKIAIKMSKIQESSCTNTFKKKDPAALMNPEGCAPLKSKATSAKSGFKHAEL